MAYAGGDTGGCPFGFEIGFDPSIIDLKRPAEFSIVGGRLEISLFSMTTAHLTLALSPSETEALKRFLDREIIA